MNPRPIIIDTDPGIDDAAAIAFALHHPALDVHLISTVHGNVNVQQTTTNALKLLTFFNQSTPVVQGQATPLVRKAIHAEHVHGDDGLAGFNFASPTFEPSTENAIITMRNTIVSSTQPITLVPIGPLTNISLLFRTFPEVQQSIDSIVLMGGSVGAGNVTPSAEFNVYADPEAAQIVFNSGIPITMVGLDVTRKSNLPFPCLSKIKSMNPTGTMLYHLFKHYRNEAFQDGLNIYDAYTIMYLCYPNLFQTKEAHVEVELSHPQKVGRTYVTFESQYTNATIVQHIESEDFVNTFMKMLAYCP